MTPSSEKGVHGKIPFGPSTRPLPTWTAAGLFSRRSAGSVQTPETRERAQSTKKKSIYLYNRKSGACQNPPANLCVALRPSQPSKAFPLRRLHVCTVIRSQDVLTEGTRIGEPLAGQHGSILASRRPGQSSEGTSPTGS